MVSRALGERDDRRLDEDLNRLVSDSVAHVRCQKTHPHPNLLGNGVRLWTVALESHTMVR